MEAVCPTLVIVRDYVLADARPLFVILWGIDAIGFYLGVIFDSYAESVIRLCTRLNYRLKINVGEGEIVVFGIVLIRVKVAEGIRNVDESAAAVNTAAIVESYVGDACVFYIVELAE